MQPLWYRNAVVYQVDPSLFRDTTGDGCGDLHGVIDRLDYLRALGITCIWMLPFYASPFRDGGYDVVDHLAVDPRFVWADTPEATDVEPGFPTVEGSVWTWDEVAQQYYRHVLGPEDLEVEVQDEQMHDLVDLLCDSDYDAPQRNPLRLRLKGYGYRWLRPRAHLFG